jgi:hypothetical protein
MFNSTGVFQGEITVLEHLQYTHTGFTVDVYTVSQGHCAHNIATATITPISEGMFAYHMDLPGHGFSSKERGTGYMMPGRLSMIGTGTTMIGTTTYTYSTAAGRMDDERRVVSSNTLVDSTGHIAGVRLTELHGIEEWTFRDLVQALNCQ